MNPFRLVQTHVPPVRNPSIPIGDAVLENADRAAYQSARTPTPDNRVAPLPLTLAQAWAEAFPE